MTMAETWTASSDAEWCKIEQAGEKLKLTADGHNGLELRTAKVTVKAERAVDAVVEVRQSAAVAATLELSSEELEFKAKTEETKTITIETNQAEVKIDEEGMASWCHVTLADDNASLSVTLDLNTEAERETTFTVIAGTESNQKEASVKVKQADGSVTIELSETEIELNSLGYRVIVTTGFDVNQLLCASDADWCKAEIKDEGIVISATTNFGENDRDAVVTVSDEKKTSSVEVKVTQTGEELKMYSIFSYKGKDVGIVIRNENNRIDVWALEEKAGLVWSTETKKISNYLDTPEGYLAKVKKEENWKEKYPVFAYCAEMDEKTGMDGWCIPEAKSLKDVFPNIILKNNLNEFNKALADLEGQEQYDNNTRKIYAKYWTCSEGSQDALNNVYIWQYSPYYYNAMERNKTSAESGNSDFPEMIARCVWSYTY